MDDSPEDHLVLQAKDGDVEAFTALARHYHERIYHTILGLTRNHCDADDLAQETFMQAFKSLRKFKQDSGFYTWLYRIAVNLALNFLKKTQREKRKTESVMHHISGERPSIKTVSSPEKQSMRIELRDQLKQALDSLPLPYKAAFLLVEFDGMSHRQAAYVLKCSENTISWRLHKARKILRTKLSPHLVREE